MIEVIRKSYELFLLHLCQRICYLIFVRVETPSNDGALS